MSSEIEAAGAALTAGLAASAIDERRKGYGSTAHGPCANCGAALTGDFCAACGQPAHVHRSLGHMAEEFLHGILHFDSRAWRTFPLLVFQPGTLTHNYIHGKRARYISPLAIFLLTVFTMFFVFSLTGGARVGVSDPATQEAANARTIEQVRAKVAEAEKDLAENRAEAATDPVAAEDTADLEGAVKALRSTLTTAEIGLARSPEAPAAQAPADPPAAVRDIPKGALADKDDDINVNLNHFDSGIYERVAEAARSGKINVNTGFPDLDKKILHKLENPELAVYKIQNGAYKLAFLLAPISLPFVWLLFFWKKGMTLFDHTVFILYSLSFVSLLFILVSLASMLRGAIGDGFGALFLAIPVHFYFQMKGSYSLGWFSALWRLPILLIFAVISLAVFLATILVLGFVG